MYNGGGIKYPLYWICFVLILVLGMSARSWSNYSIDQLPYSSEYNSDTNEVISPGNWINESQIKITKDNIRIDITNATWAKFANTNSMDPVIDNNMNSIEIRPKDPSQINIGDIISYKAKFIEGLVVHRIVNISEDENGIYYITKGDNNNSPDPQKVRFEDIHGVVIAIIF